MALTGRFNADFAPFFDACQRAEVALRPIESGANKVGQSLNRMVDGFTGRKLITDAALMVEAVDRVGGVSKLTERELARVGVTANEAADKMRRMGLDVPPGLQKIADATKGVGAAASSTTPVLSGMASQLARMFTVGAVVAFGRSVLAAGDNIQKMADQTGLGTDEVQRLQHIAGQSGTSMQSLVGAIQNLQQRLGDDDTGAAGAMKKLGINAEAFNKLSTYAQLTSLAEAVRGIKDPTEQASVAADLFGKTWKEILPAIKSGMESVGNQAPIMADETVKALDRVGDALTRAKAQGVAWGGAFVTAYEEAGFALGDFLSRFNPEHFGMATSEVLKLYKQLNDPDGLKGALESVKPPVVAVGAAIQAFSMSAADATRIGRELTESARESIAVNQAADAAIRAHANAVQGLVDTLSGGGAITQVELLREAMAKSGPISAMTLDSQKKINAMVKDAIAVYAAAGQSIPADLLRIQAATTNLSTATQDWLGKSLAGFQQFRPGMADLLFELKGIDKLPAVFAGATAEMSDGLYAMANSTTFLTRSFSQLGPTIMSAMTGGGDAIKSVGSLFGGELTKSIFGGDAMKKSITSIFGSTLGGAFNALLPGIGAIAGPLLSKIAGLFKGVFGASEKELGGRDVAKQFREELERTLNATQKLEAGTDQWKKSVIAVRDAYIAHGRAGEEALTMMDRLWRAEKEGPEAVKRIIEEITAVMEGSFTNAIVSTGAVVTETIGFVADAAVEEMNRIADEIKYYDRGTGQTGEDARRMSPEDARAAIDSFVAHGGSRDWAEKFLEANPGDEGRLESARFDYRPSENRPEDALTPAQMGFAGGTGGKYLDFGRGTSVVLHGREQVKTAAEGQADAATWAGMAAQLRSMENMIGRLPLMIRDALLLAR